MMPHSVLRMLRSHIRQETSQLCMLQVIITFVSAIAPKNSDYQWHYVLRMPYKMYTNEATCIATESKVHGANMGPTSVGPRRAPGWPHEPCYQGHSLKLDWLGWSRMMYDGSSECSITEYIMWQCLPCPVIPLPSTYFLLASGHWIIAYGISFIVLEI